MDRTNRRERGGKDVPRWRNSEELRTLASLEHVVHAGEQLCWADRLGPYCPGQGVCNISHKQQDSMGGERSFILLLSFLP